MNHVYAQIVRRQPLKSLQGSPKLVLWIIVRCSMSCSITDRYVTNCLLLVVALQAVLVRVVVLQTAVRQTVVPLIVALQAVVIRVNT
jgi:hypothetical protein